MAVFHSITNYRVHYSTRSEVKAMAASARENIGSVWRNMKIRCNDPRDKYYYRYGGRGIKVCPEWENSFENFYEWALRNGYQKGLSIDRIDNNKGYSPDNCRWVTMHEQNRNYSRNHMITYKGETKCLEDWAQEIGLCRATIFLRLKNGATVEEAFDTRDRRSLRWQKNRSLI